MSTNMLTAALDLAGNGWAVFPCRWAGESAKAPLTGRGHLEATRAPEQITSWWRRWPRAMIGAPVPVPLLVIDLDPRNNPDCHHDLVELAGELPETLTAWSGRGDGGRHLYFRRPAGQLTSTRLPAGVDLKVNGYCIMPPSIHPASGQPYRWDERLAVLLPDRLRKALRPPGPRQRSRERFDLPGDASPLVRYVASSGRPVAVNDALYWAAKKAAGQGLLTPDVVEDLVSAAASAAAAAGKLGEGGGERGSRKTIESGRRAAGGAS